MSDENLIEKATDERLFVQPVRFVRVAELHGPDRLHLQRKSGLTGRIAAVVTRMNGSFGPMPPIVHDTTIALVSAHGHFINQSVPKFI